MHWFTWLRTSSFRINTLALILMLITPILLYQAAQAGSTNLIWLLIGILALANLIILWMD
jgi:hypothetical protein